MNKNQKITLRRTEVGDLEVLFNYQMDEEYGHMAAFVNENYQNKDVYIEKWTRLLADPTVDTHAILLDNKVVGSVGTWMLEDEPQITYGVGKEFWGKGIVTEALRQFLAFTDRRPLYGRAAADNVASISILKKCGFKKIGDEQHYAHARGKEIDEVVYVLEG